MRINVFDCDVLWLLNVAPTQLHPNSWGFIIGFKILCRALHMSRRIGVFFSFFEIIGKGKSSWYLFAARVREGF